ncbi:hypothetical protein OIU84_008054 [Salix udensis]|uniref:Kinesin motor domain-containing protein n=1 Tax=Salix udensis TaxID=889485 RepID=A0AAD6JWC4_9ROSI|nr:hypothetical protein OIU84_008054 [Salix udensis]
MRKFRNRCYPLSPSSMKFYKYGKSNLEEFNDLGWFVGSTALSIYAFGDGSIEFIARIRPFLLGGAAKTHNGPNGASKRIGGVNYRALNDLFSISQNRRDSFLYEIQPNGLAVPDASMHPVTSTSDVLELIGVGLKNRAVGATAMNERSSRSHSVVSIHVRGKDLLSGAALHGNLHLVDLAGSERVDRSEATGDRLKEAQHINKSLSALGDVIFSLAQKNSHVPYRNSKLTQLLQSSLGGQAKTLMFVQLNPDVSSYSETISTLKFAERVSGVELGAARSSKEGRDVRELMDQLASLKDTIARKDDEIEQLQLIKDHKNEYPGSMRYGDSSASNDSSGVILRFEDGDYEDRSSDISDGVPSVVTDPDGATDQSTKLSETFRKSKVASTIRLLQNQTQNASKAAMVSRDNPKGSTSVKNTVNSNLVKPPKRWQ